MQKLDKQLSGVSWVELELDLVSELDSKLSELIKFSYEWQCVHVN